MISFIRVVFFFLDWCMKSLSVFKFSNKDVMFLIKWVGISLILYFNIIFAYKIIYDFAVSLLFVSGG